LLRLDPEPLTKVSNIPVAINFSKNGISFFATQEIIFVTSVDTNSYVSFIV
jgi:hypothetical protein